MKNIYHGDIAKRRWTKVHEYTYIQCFRSERGTKWMLRRDDGKRVIVSRKQFNQLVDEHRIITKGDSHGLCRDGKTG